MTVSDYHIPLSLYTQKFIHRTILTTCNKITNFVVHELSEGYTALHKRECPPLILALLCKFVYLYFLYIGCDYFIAIVDLFTF